MLLRTRFLWVGCLLVLVGASAACGGASLPEQVLAATVTASPGQAAPSTLTPTAAPDWRKEFIGLIYPPLPPGWESIAGALTFSTCELTRPCSSGEESYGVSQWRQTNPTTGTAEELLLFEKLLGYALDGRPIWTVLDVLVGSEVGGTNWLTQGCRPAGSAETDDEIVALYSIVQDPSGPAWRANHLTGRFEPIAGDGLICVDENAVD